MSTDSHRVYEVRCPVYGFIALNDLEWQIIRQPAFQRLRRIRQLGWTDQVFPGAMHTRFEHSLGVMNMASILYDGIVARSHDILRSEFGYKDDGFGRHRQLVRLATLLHDVGHGPFSHAAEELLPNKESEQQRYSHENYSAAIVRQFFKDVVKNHPLNINWGLSADSVADLLEGRIQAGDALFWRDLIDGQLDADRMDYLLRDSLHCGVGYGRYDWQRLANTLVATPVSEGADGPRIGVSEGGWHAAEGLIVARYFMFTQVYFHKTRVIYDHHLHSALSALLPKSVFPPPVGNGLQAYLKWDDWKVLGLLSSEKGGDGGRRLSTRDHFREVAHTSERPRPDELKRLDAWRDALGEQLAAEALAEKSWYKVGAADIQVVTDLPKQSTATLSTYSSVVGKIEPIRQVRLYARSEHRDDAKSKIAKIWEALHGPAAN